MHKNFSGLEAQDISSLLHPYTQLAAHREKGPKIISHAKGVYIYDQTGKDYIEGLAGLWCTSLGYSNEELIEAAQKQFYQIPYTHIFAGKSHAPAIELAEKLKSIAPGNFAKVTFVGSGSEANDTQVKLAWYMNNALGRPKKKKIISRLRGYHGVTVASASLTGLPANHAAWDLPLEQVRHTKAPYAYRNGLPGESETEFSARLAKELEDMILAEDPETVAAFIAEPVMGAGGVIIPPQGYFEAIQAVLSKYDIMMIDDEVICGFGRLGTRFGAERLGMKPDTISVAKQLSSAYLPIGAVLIPEFMDEAITRQSADIGTFGHGYTYSGHPVAAAVALKTLEIYERDNIIGKVQAIEPLFNKLIQSFADHPLVGDARSLGLIGALEIVADKKSKRSFEAKQTIAARIVGMAEEEGVILRACYGDVIAFCPPLIITEDELTELFLRFGRALKRAEDWISKEGLRDA